MDTVEFVLERKRMCESNYDRETECKYCVAYDSCGDRTKCKALMLNDTNIKTKTDFMIAVSIVGKWSKEHPRKTRAQDFFDKYPNAPKSNHDVPSVCAAALGYREFCKMGCEEIDCKKCWNEPV